MTKRTQRDVGEQPNTSNLKRPALDVIKVRAQAASSEQRRQQETFTSSLHDQEVLDHGVELTQQKSPQEIQQQPSIEEMGNHIINVTKRGEKLQDVIINDEDAKKLKIYIKGCLAKGSDICKKALRKVENACASRKETKKRYNSSDKRKKTRKCYDGSDKGKEVIKRYDSSDKGKETRKRYDSSDKRKEAIKRYDSSDKRKEARKRFQESFCDPVAVQQILQKRMKRTHDDYTSRLKKLEQSPDSLQAQKQKLLQDYKDAQQVHQQDYEKALRDANKLAQIEKEVATLLHAVQSDRHQQEQFSTGISFEDFQARETHTTFQDTHCFQENYDELHGLLQALNHASELEALEAFNVEHQGLSGGLDTYIGEDLESLLASFADPEHFEQASRLDF
jgi:hypothetical protein